MKQCIMGFFLCMGVWTMVSATPVFLLDTEREWQTALDQLPDENLVRLPTIGEIDDLEDLWLGPNVEGYPPEFGEFRTPELYVYEDVDPAEPDDQPGLVMAWGDPSDEGTNEDLSAGWVMEYGRDPDLTNCTIKLKVTPPSFITSVTFGLIDLEGDQISWTWNNLPSSPPNPMTLITINTNNIAAMGINAPVPPATGYAPNANFDINKVVSFFINETFHTTPGIFNVPLPGGGLPVSLGWNAWDEFEVQPNTTTADTYKGYHIKYSQPPHEEASGEIYGWDQLSYYQYFQQGPNVVFMAADDWKCTDSRPVTDFHWWGSFKGWTRTYPPSVVPDYFMIGIWKDVPAGVEGPYSHPKELIWSHKCYKWVWNYAGVDLDPRCNYDPVDIDPDFYDRIGPYILNAPACEQGETCFQFNQLLSEDEYFEQEEGVNIYWVSIAAVYENISDPTEIDYPWGWKTKPYDDEKAPDIAVIINNIDTWPLTPFVTNVTNFKPIILPNATINTEPFDLTFELSTNQKEPGSCYEHEGDINHDCIVDLADFTMLADDWLKTSIP